VVKRKSIVFVLLSVMALVSLVSLGIPKPAQAAVPLTMTYQWSGAAFQGTDDFYGGNVVAYTAGDNASLAVTLQNNLSMDMTIKSAKVKFDWGNEYAATSFPSELKAGAYGVAKFEFAVPSTDVATNMALHGYQVSVVYEVQDGAAVVNRVAWENLALDPGNDLNNAPIVPDSETLYDVTATTVTAIAASNYTLNDSTGVVAWVLPYAPSGTVYAAYKYTEAVFTGDGVEKVGYLDHAPVVAGSEIVCIKDTVAGTITTQASTAYTIDYDTGKITLTTAPNAWQSVGVYYRYYQGATDGAVDFAVYSADQAAAQILEQKWDGISLGPDYPNGSGIFGLGSPDGYKAWEDARRAADQADAEYDAGNFASAKADFQSAMTNADAAFAADASLGKGFTDALTGIGTGAGGWLDAQAAKADADAASTTALVNAQKDKLQGEACKAKSYGTFLILMGVGGILVGLGGLLWGVSRVIGARKANQ